MGKINNVWYGELYALVNSSNVEEREEFYAYAAEAVAPMRRKDNSLPLV